MGNAHKSSGIFSSFLSGGTALQREKQNLEALLAAAPGGFCLVTPEGTVERGESLRRITALTRLETLADLEKIPADKDAAEFSRNLAKLQTGTGFRQSLQTADGRSFIFSGNRINGITALWAEDISEVTGAQAALAADKIALEKERTRLLGVLDAIPRPVWMRGNNQDIIWCNRVYAQAAGLTPAQVIAEQKELGQRKKKESGPQPGRELAKTALEKGEVQKTQAHVIIAGSRLLMNIAEIPLPALGITLGLGLDVTREEELEAQLRRYQAANHNLLEQLRTAIGVFNADTQLEFYNSAFAQLWGLEDQWLNTQPKIGDIMEKLRETRRLPEQADFRKYKQSWLDFFTRLIEPHEDMMHLPDGTALRMLIVPHPMGGIMMTFEDVTGRLQLESSYNTLIAVQKETLDNLAEAVAVYGGDGRLKLWNPAFGRLWNLNPEDLEGEPHISRTVEKLKGFFSPESWPRRKEELTSLGLDRVMHEGRFERLSGSVIDYMTVPLPDGGVLITCTDVSDSVRVENALRDKNAALEAAEKLKLDFLANVSYQLRTPLNAIMGFTEILGQEYFGPLNARQKEYAADIHKASNRLLDLINDILDLSTIEAGYLTLHRQDVKVGAMLESVIDLVADWARKEKIRLTLDCPKNIGTLKADESRLKQAIVNLIRNAIAFTPEGGSIELSAKKRKDGIEIRVSDTGIGIPEEDQRRILRPFEKAASKIKDSRKEQRGGAGLGLSLVQNIVTLHGGSMELVSTPGKGTTVTLFIPSEPAKKRKAA